MWCLQGLNGGWPRHVRRLSLVGRCRRPPTSPALASYWSVGAAHTSHWSLAGRAVVRRPAGWVVACRTRLRYVSDKFLPAVCAQVAVGRACRAGQAPGIVHMAMKSHLDTPNGMHQNYQYNSINIAALWYYIKKLSTIVFRAERLEKRDLSAWPCRLCVLAFVCTGLDLEKLIERSDLLGWVCWDGFARLALKG